MTQQVFQINKPSSWWQIGDLWLTAAIFGTILLLVLPVPPLMMDMLLASSISLSLLVALVILYIKDPVDFTGFPTLLLVVTLYRLALNVASTRLILLNGYAGNIIDAFGNFVVRGNYVVGLVVFFILVLINFVVITKGAGRIAEVAARFTLDAMPGKQMSIDADLNAGIITEEEARERRKKVEQEADFYGAMDGASKFVRGDAIAAVLITLINIIGGFAIGVLQKGLTVAEAVQKYTVLSIGDGLVSQIPALITSTAAGILVTRAAAKDNLSREIGRQLLFYPRALLILAGMLVIMGLIPGLPYVPFFVMAAAAAGASRLFKGISLEHEVEKVEKKKPSLQKQPKEQQALSAPSEGMESFKELLVLDTLQIELGYGLIPMADTKKGGDLLLRVTNIRKNIASELGIMIPPIRIRDNLQLSPNEYRILLRGNEVGRGQLFPNQYLAMNTTGSKYQLKGTPTIEPVFHLPAIWIAETERNNAEIHGYTVVDAASVLVTHLSEIIRRNCHEILTRQDVQFLLDTVKQSHPAVVNELVPTLLTIGQVHRVLQNLLAEGLPIKNLVGILEKIADLATVTKNPDELSEYARRALTYQIVQPYITQQGTLKVITLDPALEQQIANCLRPTQTEISLLLDPQLARHLLSSIAPFIQKMLNDGLHPILTCAGPIRLGLKRFFNPTFPDLVVIAYHEIPPRIEIQSVGVIRPLEVAVAK